MSVLEALAGGGEERFDQLGFAELAEEAEGVAPDVLVGVLKIVPDTVAVRREVRYLDRFSSPSL
jgi:hypothetical protein